MEALGEERLIGRIENMRVIDGFHETIEYSTYLFGEKKRHRVATGFRKGILRFLQILGRNNNACYNLRL